MYLNGMDGGGDLGSSLIGVDNGVAFPFPFLEPVLFRCVDDRCSSDGSR